MEKDYFVIYSASFEETIERVSNLFEIQQTLHENQITDNINRENEELFFDILTKYI